MKEIPVVIFGLDKIGSALIEQLHKKEDTLARQNCTRFKVVAVADQTHWFFVPEGLSTSAQETILARKHAGEPIGGAERPHPATIVQMMQGNGIERGMLVDTTESLDMEPAMQEALLRGFSVSSTNSQVMSAPWRQVYKYFHNPQVRFESTFGSGLPIMATLCYLHDIKDDFYQLEGQFLGLANMIKRVINQNESGADLVSDLIAQGLSPQEVADHLTGATLLRRLVIMGRLAGWPLELKDIGVDPLIEIELDSNSNDAVSLKDELVQKIDALKADLAAKEKRPAYTHYWGEITSQGGHLRISETKRKAPLAGLNAMRFHTRMYSVEPLLLSGAGQRIDMTAGSILGDMLGLARENY